MRCVLCDGGKAEGMCHFVLRCSEFGWERRQVATGETKKNGRCRQMAREV